MIDETVLRRITANFEIFGAKPIIRGMRISLELILSLLAQGEYRPWVDASLMTSPTVPSSIPVRERSARQLQ
ncbi:MAG: DUF433 domain-containing protein [Pyrinomonadaceae bacterium]